MPRSFFWFLVGIVGIQSITLASDYQSPRTIALGGAGHAGPLLNDAIYLNPSFCAYLPNYSAAFSGLKYDGGSYQKDRQTVDLHGRNYNISLLDGRSEMFQAGVGFNVREDAATLHVGASKAILQLLSVGLGSKFLFTKDKSRPNTQDFTLSITHIPIPWLQTVLVVDNLIEGTDARSWNMHREYTLGTKTNVMGIILLYVDPHYTPNALGDQKFGYEAGAEFPVFRDLFLRGGMFQNSYIPYQNARGKGYGLGVGWIAPKLSLDYGYQRVLESKIHLPPTSAHSISATIFF